MFTSVSVAKSGRAGIVAAAAASLLLAGAGPAHAVSPAWTDQTVASGQVGVSYVDAVAAAGLPDAYVVSVGSLPAG